MPTGQRAYAEVEEPVWKAIEPVQRATEPGQPGNCHRRRTTSQCQRAKTPAPPSQMPEPHRARCHRLKQDATIRAARCHRQRRQMPPPEKPDATAQAARSQPKRKPPANKPTPARKPCTILTATVTSVKPMATPISTFESSSYPQ